MAQYWYVVVLAGVVVVIAALLGRKLPGVQRETPVWLMSGLLGLLLGAGGALGGVYVSQQYRAKAETTNDSTKEGSLSPDRAMSMMGGGMGGGMMGGGGMGGGMMGGGGMGGGGGGGGAAAKRDLASLVGKLELLTRGLRLELDADQSAKLYAKLSELAGAEEMTAEDANSELDAINEMLTDAQKATAGSIDLPRPARQGGGGGGSGGAGAPGGAGGGGGAASKMGGGMAGGMAGGASASGGADEKANPFRQEANKKRLDDLLGRLRSGG